jgi:hypothetical protein
VKELNGAPATAQMVFEALDPRTRPKDTKTVTVLFEARLPTRPSLPGFPGNEARRDGQIACHAVVAHNRGAHPDAPSHLMQRATAHGDARVLSKSKT